MNKFSKMKARVDKLQKNRHVKPSGTIDQHEQMVTENTRVRRYLDLKKQLEAVMELDGNTDPIMVEMDAIWNGLTAKEKEAINAAPGREDLNGSVRRS